MTLSSQVLGHLQLVLGGYGFVLKSSIDLNGHPAGTQKLLHAAGGFVHQAQLNLHDKHRALKKLSKECPPGTTWLNTNVHLPVLLPFISLDACVAVRWTEEKTGMSCLLDAAELIWVAMQPFASG